MMIGMGDWGAALVWWLNIASMLWCVIYSIWQRNAKEDDDVLETKEES